MCCCRPHFARLWACSRLVIWMGDGYYSWATGVPRRDPPIDTAAAAFYSSHFAASRRVRTRRRRNRLDTASLPPVPPTKMCVACTHDSHLQSILIPPSPDPTTAATGHRGTCASSRRSCWLSLASAAPLCLACPEPPWPASAANRHCACAASSRWKLESVLPRSRPLSTRIVAPWT